MYVLRNGRPEVDIAPPSWRVQLRRCDGPVGEADCPGSHEPSCESGDVTSRSGQGRGGYEFHQSLLYPRRGLFTSRCVAPQFLLLIDLLLRPNSIEIPVADPLHLCEEAFIAEVRPERSKIHIQSVYFFIKIRFCNGMQFAEALQILGSI